MLSLTNGVRLCGGLGCWQMCFFVFFFILIIVFIYFWLCWIFVAAQTFLQLWCLGFSLQWFLLLQSTGSRHTGFSSCGMWAQQLWLLGSRAQAQQLWHVGLVAPRHVESSGTRDQTHVPCISRQILNHQTTREALLLTSYSVIASQGICWLSF